MYRIKSKVHNPYTFMNAIRSTILRCILIIAVLYLILYALPENDMIIDWIIKVTHGIVLCYVLLVLFAIVSDYGKDYSGQYIFMDQNRIEIKEMNYAPVFASEREKYFNECIIYFDEIESCYYKKTLLPNSMPKELVIHLKYDFKHSKLPDGNTEADFTISEYGYEYKQFYLVTRLIIDATEKADEIPDSNSEQPKRTMDDVIAELSKETRDITG